MSEESAIKQVKISDIIIPEVRNTSVFDADIAQEFVESVRTEGIKVPVTLMNVEGKLYLIDGLHRIQVAKELGMETVPAIIKVGTYDDVLIENLITARLRGRENPAQTCKVIKYLKDNCGYSWQDIGKRLGMSAGTAKIYYDITRLPEQVLNMIGEGKLSVYKARLLLEIPDPRDQVKAAEDVVRYGYNEAQTRELVRYYLESYADIPTTITKSTPVHGLENKFRCDVCGEFFDENPTYYWIHPECLESLLKMAQELQELKKLQKQQG